MADEVVSRESFDSLNLGILNTSIMGDMKAVDEFLSGEAVKDDVQLEELELDENGKPKAAPKKEDKIPVKPTQKKVPQVKVLDESVLDEEEGENNEEETEEEKEERLQKEAEEKKKSSTKKPEEGDNEESDNNQFEILSKELVSLGVFTQEDEKEKLPTTGEEFLQKFQEEGQRVGSQWIDGVLSRFGDDRKELFEAIFINGVDPKEYLPVYNEIQTLEALDITQEKNQERVYREFYKRLNFSPEKIEAKLAKAKDYGDLEEESKDYHQQIIEQDKQILLDKEDERKQQLLTQQRMDEAYKASISKILQEAIKNKELKGVAVNDKLANQAMDFLYTKKYKTADGQLLTDFDKFILETKRPENQEQRALIALLKLTNFDFSKIEKKGASKESVKLFQGLTPDKSKKNTAKKEDNKSWLEI